MGRAWFCAKTPDKPEERNSPGGFNVSAIQIRHEGLLCCSLKFKYFFSFPKGCRPTLRGARCREGSAFLSNGISRGPHLGHSGSAAESVERACFFGLLRGILASFVAV
jgi:hypothetical protein